MKLTTVLMSNQDQLTTEQGIISAAIIVAIGVLAYFSPKIFSLVNRVTGHTPTKAKQ